MSCSPVSGSAHQITACVAIGSPCR